MGIWDFIVAIIYGIVEGITEWIPVSSTGHMILLDEFLKMNVSDEFFELYLVVIQLGAVLAALVLFWQDIWPFGKKNNSKPFRSEGWGSYVKADRFSMWFKICVACIPGVATEFLISDYSDAHFYNFVCVAIALIVFGILFVFVEKVFCRKRNFRVNDIDEISYKDAIIIGLWQMIAAIFPGTSRSGATIVGSLLIGIKRETAAKFTFIMAVPVMFGASILKILRYDGGCSNNELLLLAFSMIVAFAVSFVVIRKLMAYIRKRSYVVFGWYRILLGIVVLTYYFVKYR